MTDRAMDFLRGKHLIVFGAGYVGGEVVRQALAQGALVTALTRNAAGARELAAGGADVVQADLAVPAAWMDQMPPAPDFVVNTVSSGGGGLAGYQHSYVDGARALLAWGGRLTATAAPLVYTSSTSVYPQGDGAVVDELAALTGGEERAAVLREAERLAWAWPGGATVLRLAGLYGPGRHHLLDALRRGEEALGGRGEHRLNLVHRDDAASAIFAALAQPEAARGQAFNVADDTAALKSEVVNWLAGRLGRQPPSFQPERVSSRRAATPDRIISNRKISLIQGWRPIYPSFRDGYAPLLAEKS